MEVNINNYISPNKIKKDEKDIAKKLLELGYIGNMFYDKEYNKNGY